MCSRETHDKMTTSMFVCYQTLPVDEADQQLIDKLLEDKGIKWTQQRFQHALILAEQINNEATPSIREILQEPKNPKLLPFHCMSNVLEHLEAWEYLGFPKKIEDNVMMWLTQRHYARGQSILKVLRLPGLQDRYQRWWAPKFGVQTHFHEDTGKYLSLVPDSHSEALAEAYMKGVRRRLYPFQGCIVPAVQSPKYALECMFSANFTKQGPLFTTGLLHIAEEDIARRGGVLINALITFSFRQNQEQYAKKYEQVYRLVESNNILFNKSDIEWVWRSVMDTSDYAMADILYAKGIPPVNPSEEPDDGYFPQERYLNLPNIQYLHSKGYPVGDKIILRRLFYKGDHDALMWLHHNNLGDVPAAVAEGIQRLPNDRQCENCWPKGRYERVVDLMNYFVPICVERSIDLDNLLKELRHLRRHYVFDDDRFINMVEAGLSKVA